MTSASVSLRTILADKTAPAAAELVSRDATGVIRCYACGHRCKVLPGRHGVCHVRFERDGELRVPWGYAAAVAIDPIEKKPFFHAYPGTEALSFGMLGCDLHCAYCQNWVTSQALRDDDAIAPPRPITPTQLVELAIENGCKVLTSTYNEPLITSEWAVEIFKLGKQAGLVGSYVSNGNGTPQVLEYIRPWVDLVKVDLKSFRDKTYRELGGVLANVLDTIRRLKQMDFWVEIVTLIIPSYNDTNQELTEIAEFLAGVSPEIPWHVTAFHPDYKMDDTPRTPAETLVRAYDLGRRAGLKFVYPGNLPGLVGEKENTTCPACGATVIWRVGFEVRRNRMNGSCCPACNAVIPGVWDNAAPLKSVGPGMPRRVRM